MPKQTIAQIGLDEYRTPTQQLFLAEMGEKRKTSEDMEYYQDHTQRDCSIGVWGKN